MHKVCQETNVSVEPISAWMIINNADSIARSPCTLGKLRRRASRGLYCSALGMEVPTFPEGRKALVFGQQKINLHEYGKGFGPRANSSATGSADSCFVSTESLEPVINH